MTASVAERPRGISWSGPPDQEPLMGGPGVRSRQGHYGGKVATLCGMPVRDPKVARNVNPLAIFDTFLVPVLKAPPAFPLLGRGVLPVAVAAQVGPQQGPEQLAVVRHLQPPAPWPASWGPVVEVPQDDVGVPA